MDIVQAETRYRERLSSVTPLSSPDFGLLQLQTEHLPSWWAENGNVLLSLDGAARLNIAHHPAFPYPRNALIIAATAGLNPELILLWGESPIVSMGQNVHLAGSVLNCGGGSTIVLGDNLYVAGAANLNAPNGGMIYVGADGLWSTGLRLFTDDFHAILDLETGERINHYGGTIVVGDHVWLGLEVMLLGGAKLGRDCVVGARTIVSSETPSNAVVAGVPARVVRTGVTWSVEDTPPSLASAGWLGA